MEIICDCGKQIPELEEVKGKIHAFCKFCLRMYFITRSPFNKSVKKKRGKK